MSVLLQFAMFPTDKGASVSKEVSKIIKMIKNSGTKYKLTAMGTIIETETLQESLEIVKKAHEVIKNDTDRIYSTLSIDIRKDKNNRLEGKINSIEEKIGNVNS